MSAGQFKPIRAAIVPPKADPVGHVKLVRPASVPATDEDDDAPIGGPRPATGTHRKPTTLPATGAHRKPTTLPPPGSADAKPGSAAHAKPGSAGHRKPTTLPATGAQPGAPGSAGHRKPTTLPSGTHTKPTEASVGHWTAPATAKFRRPDAVAEPAQPTSVPATASHARPVPATASYPKPSTTPATGSHTKPATGSHTKPATGSHTKPATGSHTKPATGSHAKPTVPATARHAKPARAGAQRERDVSMGTFAAAMVGLVVAFVGAVVGARHLRPVPPVEEPPAWSYDRDAALLAAAEPAPPAEPAESPEPVQRERVQLPVVVADGAITIGADDPLTEQVEATLTISTESFDTTIQAVHRDPERQEHWIDLVDGRRIEVDDATAAAVLEAQPYRMTYERVDEPAPGEGR